MFALYAASQMIIVVWIIIADGFKEISGWKESDSLPDFCTQSLPLLFYLLNLGGSIEAWK